MKVERMAETGENTEPQVLISPQMGGPGEKPIELVKPGEQRSPQHSEPIQPTTEELLKLPFGERMRYVVTLPEDKQVEVMRNLKLEIKGGAERDPGSIVAELVEIDTLTAEQREARAEDYTEDCEQLTDYANGDQVFKEDNKITDLRKQLINFDKAYINSDPDRTEVEKRSMQQLLNALDEAELALQQYESTLAVRDEAVRNGKEPKWFSKQGWQKQEEQRDRFEVRVEVIKGEVADDEFIQSRTNKKAEIEKRIQNIQDQAKKREEEEKKQRLSEPSEEEQKWLEDYGKLEKDKPITVEEAEVVSLPKFSDVLEQLKAQERLKRVNDPNFNETIYNQSKENVGWYFQEAGRLGMLFDLNEQLDSDFKEYMTALHIQPVDERRLPPSKITISELRDSIRGKLQGGINRESLRTPGKPELVESNDVWEDLGDTVRFSATRTKEQFAGVRAEYLTRGYEQMRASFTNLIHLQARLKLQTDLIRGKITDTEYRNKIVNIARDTQQNYRVYGEWNFGFEAAVRQQIEKLALAEQAKPLFHETELGFIVLEGENSREIELAAEQAAEFITSSAGTYSLEAIQQRRDYLLRAIENKRKILSAETGGAKKETDALVNRIKDVALNKLDFFILHWFAQNLRMPEYSSYFEQTVMQRGTDRFKVVPTMSDGLVGLAIRYLLMSEYRLFFQPGGFKNQLGESDPQAYLRVLLQERLVNTLMGFELDDQGKGWEGKAKTLQELMKVQATDQFLKYFKHHEKSDIDPNNPSQHPAARLARAEKAYKDAFDDVRISPNDPEALIKLREARDFRAFEQNRYQTAKNRVINAVEEAVRVMDITGESARLGAPSIIMGNGDHISIEEVTLFYKFAILEAAKDHGLASGTEDNQALIRWRSRMWIDRWKKVGLARDKAGRDFAAGGKDGNKLAISLKEGWEETGLSLQGWQAFEDAAQRLREKGYNATITVTKRDEKGKVVRDTNGQAVKEEVKFEDIIKDPRLQSVRSNFLADYKSSKDQLSDDYLRLQAFKGRLPAFKNILIRLGIMRPVEGKHQRVMNEYTQAIENSRAFHAEIERLAIYEATHASLEKVKKQSTDRTIYMDSVFSADRIDYGYQGLPWGIKRAQHRKAFNYNNLRRTTSRAVDLIHAIPMSLTSLSQESAADDILDMFWNLNRMEKDDNWTLMTFAMRNRDTWFIGSRLDGGDVDLEKGGGKQHTFLEKVLTDANSLWALIARKVAGATPEQAVQKLLAKDGIGILTEDSKEEIVKYLLETTLNRFTPIVLGVEKQLSNDRQAMGSGAGYEENEKFALRFLEWLLSEKPESEEHGGREEGGMEVYEGVADIIRFITRPGSYRAVYKTVEGKVVYPVEGKVTYQAKGEKQEFKKEQLVLDLEKSSSIWDEVWRKLRPGHSIRLSKQAPEPTYVALAA